MSIYIEYERPNVLLLVWQPGKGYHPVTRIDSNGELIVGDKDKPIRLPKNDPRIDRYREEYYMITEPCC